jgi:crotonobetainyl-CoA:carnitine CoA-transferase CaiB-like acyl-CoA transferase
MTEGHFENFCETLDRKDLLADPRFATGAARLAHARECIAVLDEIFAARDLVDWLQVLPGLTTPWTVVQTAGEAATDPQVVAGGLVAHVDDRFPLVRTPAQFDGVRPELRPAPDHGQHTEEVLLELGRSWEEILELKARDAVL